MAQKGPKRLSSTELKARGSRPDVVKRRAREEGLERLRVVPMGATPQTITVPPDITDTMATDLYQHVRRSYQLELIGETVLMEACFALQRSRQCRVQIDRDGLVDISGVKASGHPLLSAERDSRALYLRLLDRLGLLD